MRPAKNGATTITASSMKYHMLQALVNMCGGVRRLSIVIQNISVPPTAKPNNSAWPTSNGSDICCVASNRQATPAAISEYCTSVARSIGQWSIVQPIKSAPSAAQPAVEPTTTDEKPFGPPPASMLAAWCASTPL